MNDYGYSVQQISDGGFIIAGKIYSSGTGPDAALIRTDSLGNALWIKTYGGTNNDEGRSVQQTKDGGFVMAGFTQSFGTGIADFYSVRTDSLGDTLWTKTYGGPDWDEGWSVQQTTDGGFIIAGCTLPLNPTPNYGDFYIVRTDSVGDTLWTRTYGGDTTDFCYSVQQTKDGGFVMAGFTLSFGAGQGDVYLVKIDSMGDTLWTKAFGGTNLDEGWSIQQTTDDGFIIAGITFSFGIDGDVYLIRTDSSGNTLWTKTYGGTKWDNGFSAKQTIDGGFIIVGYTTSFGAGYYDVYIVRTNSLGDTLWTKTVGGDTTDLGWSVQQTKDGGFIIVGLTESFGVGSTDIYLIRLGKEMAGTEEPNVASSFSCTSYPDPVLSNAFIEYTLPEDLDIVLRIHNITGTCIKELTNGMQKAGKHTVCWNGTDNRNKKVSACVYFYSINANNSKAFKSLPYKFSLTNKLILLNH